MKLWSFILVALSGVGCDPHDVQETASAYYGGLSEDALVERTSEMARLMPFYITGTALALLLMGLAIFNGLDHARNLGRKEGIRFGAYVLLLCFISLFLAIEVRREWLPAGNPLPAFAAMALLGMVSTTLAARASPERAILMVGYVVVTLTLPLIGLLASKQIYLMDTTASLFIGFASGLLATVVFSDPVRSGLVDFLRRRETESRRRGPVARGSRAVVCRT